MICDLILLNVLDGASINGGQAPTLTRKINRQQVPGDETMGEVIKAKAGTILVVNKDLLPLWEIVATLRAANFDVLQAHSEVKAVNVAASYAKSIDLVLADSELLGWSYPSLADTLRLTRPDLQVVLFCGEIVIGSFGCILIPSPLIPAKILEIINAVLHPAEPSQLIRSAGSAG